MTDVVLRIDSQPSGDWSAAWHVAGQSAGEPISVPAAEAKALADFARQFEQQFGRTDQDGHATRPIFPVTALESIGQQFFDRWCQPVWDAIEAQLQVAARSANEAFATHRLFIQSNRTEALNLPWELLPLGPDQGPLGCDAAWSLYRTPLDELPAEVVAAGPGPLRILFLAAAPEDQATLDFEQEEEALLRATQDLRGAVIHIAELGTFDELRELVHKIEPHVVHLSGHGTVSDDGRGTFCFENEAGRTDARSADELVRELFRGSSVQCVFLNACKTSQAAVSGLCQALVEAGLPLAIGWAASVADDRATNFAETFYRQLLEGEPVPAAMAHARLRLQREGRIERAIDNQDAQDATYLLPQLYCSAPLGWLHDRRLPERPYHGPKTEYELLPGGVEGLREGFVGRRREQQQLIPPLRQGEITVAILHGIGGQGKSTLTTRVANRLAIDGFEIVAVKALREDGEAAESCARRVATELLSELRLTFARAGHDQLAALMSEGKYTEVERLQIAVDGLNQLKFLVVLDNFEDVLQLETRQIADESLAAFYRRAMTNLTRGSRLIVTTRYVPAGTPSDARLVRLCESLGDFKEHDFLKFLRRDPGVEQQMRRGALPHSLLQDLFGSVGGTPRFLDALRRLLRSYDAERLREELAGAGGQIEAEREKYLEQIFGPKLYELLSPESRRAVSRLAVSERPLPADAIALIAELDSADAAIAQAVDYGLLQEFAAPERPTLYLPPGLLRPWLSGSPRLSMEATRAVHSQLAAFWKQALEAKRAAELRITIMAGLEACRRHAGEAGEAELFRWSTLLLARQLQRVSEWRTAKKLLEEIPTADRDGEFLLSLGHMELNLGNWPIARSYFEQVTTSEDTDEKSAGSAWHQLASIDLNEGDYAAARENFQKSLTIKQQIGDRAGEAATWAQIGTIEVFVGNYAEARKNYEKARNTLQQIGDRAGEAATWHNLATIDLNEGKYAAAREKFQKSLTIAQQIGDHAGEAATWAQIGAIEVSVGNYAEARKNYEKARKTLQQIGDRAGEAKIWHQLATIDLDEGDYAAAREKFQKSLTIKQQIGDRAGEATTWHQLASIDLNEGDYAAAREKFQKVLTSDQQIGNRAGEATTLQQLGVIAVKLENLEGGTRLVACCYLIDQAIGHGDTQSDLQTLLSFCSQLGYTQEQVQKLLEETAASYQQDRGASLIRQAFEGVE